MKKFFVFIFVLSTIIGGSFLLQSFVSPNSDKILVDENRQVESFNKISVSGSFEVFVKQGSQSVHIEADQNLLQKIETKVENNELKIGWEKHAGNKINNDQKVIIHISLPELEGLSISGSGKIIGESNFASKHLSNSIAGSGEISVEVSASKISSDIAGSGNILVIGSCDQSYISIAGSGNYEASDLETKETEISIAGSGSAKVNVSSILDIDIAGSGEVLYKGNPKIETSIAGSGKVKKQSL